MTAPRESQQDIDRRVARFYTTRHARDLWPDVPVSAFRAAALELGRVATAVLGGAPGPVPLRSSREAGARALSVAAFAGAVGPLVGYWCETGRVTADPEVRTLLATHLEHGRRRVALLRRELERVLDALAEREVPVWVLKGMHTAYRYFPDPGTRAGADIDLLVSSDDWTAAREGLAGLGLVEKRHPSQPRDSAWVPRDTPHVPSLSYAHADAPWSVDLHRSLDRLPFEGLETRLGAPLEAAGEVWDEFRHPVRILKQPLLFAYLGLHASSHFYGITQIRLIELVLVARRDFGERGDAWEAFFELVARTGSSRFVLPALDLAARLVPGSIDPGVLDRIARASPRRLVRLVRGMEPAAPQRLYPYPALRERFVWLASLGELVAALGWLLWPREDEKPVRPGKAVQAQWRRVRRAGRRMVQAWIGR